ncbi:MAG: hypothetical protein AAGJ93_04320 [Bacteroidota bacterium]
MNDDILTFHPDSNDQLYLWLGIALALLAFGACYYFLKKPAQGRSYTNQTITAMLFFFVGLMASSTAFFSGWNLRRQGNISLKANEMIIGVNQVAYSDIKDLYLRKDQASSALGMPSTEAANLILIVEKKNGKTFAISSTQFPINEIYGELKLILDK